MLVLSLKSAIVAVGGTLSFELSNVHEMLSTDYDLVVLSRINNNGDHETYPCHPNKPEDKELALEHLAGKKVTITASCSVGQEWPDFSAVADAEVEKA